MTSPVYVSAINWFCVVSVIVGADSVSVLRML